MNLRTLPNLLTLLLLLAISCQALGSSVDVHLGHQSGMQHVEIDHNHEQPVADVKSVSNDAYDCHHCCHCHSVVQVFLPQMAINAYVLRQPQVRVHGPFVPMPAIVSDLLRPPRTHS